MSDTDNNTPNNDPVKEILVVDDKAQNAELLEAYLLSLNANIRIASDGIEALEMVAQQKPDIVLLDIMMPRMSGFEVCQKLKASDDTKNIPVVLVTALNEMGDIERGVDCGADDFLSKPINKLELITRVKSLLKVRTLHSELEKTLSYLEEMESNGPAD